jgi:hypothetical protein
MNMLPEISTSQSREAARIALWSILGEFLDDRRVLEPSWYRLVSAHKRYKPGTKEPSHSPTLSKVFWMKDRFTDELLWACGLLQQHGNQL